jgi:hypothetical protein
MTVKITKPSINVREELADLKKPTGIAGEAMLRAETPQEQFNLIGAGRRNLVINGAMTVAQRGTSFADADGIYTLDRFRFNTAAEDEFVATVSQSTDAPDGFSTSLRVDVTTAESAIASDERVSIEQRIEAQDLQHLNYGTSAARTTTLSMWVKSSRSGKYGVNIRAHDASDNYNASLTINNVDTWEHKTMIIDGNMLANGGITNDNGLGLWFRVMLLCGTDFRTNTVDQWVTSSSHNAPTDAQNTWGTATTDDFYLTGVQWELGKVATPFEHRSYGEELAACQRYYYLHSPEGSYLVVQYQAGYRCMQVDFPTTMRAPPAFSVATFSNFSSFGGSSISRTNMYAWVAANYTNTSSMTVSNVSFDAEL